MSGAHFSAMGLANAAATALGNSMADLKAENTKLLEVVKALHGDARMLLDALVNLAPYPPEVAEAVVAIVDVARKSMALASPFVTPEEKKP